MPDDMKSNGECRSKDHFVRHLENASRIVNGWPAWKQSVLGRRDSASTPREGQCMRQRDVNRS